MREETWFGLATDVVLGAALFALLAIAAVLR